MRIIILSIITALFITGCGDDKPKEYPGDKAFRSGTFKKSPPSQW